MRRRSDRVGVLLQAADSKREQFQRYLEKSGVLDTLTKGKAVRGGPERRAVRGGWGALPEFGGGSGRWGRATGRCCWVLRSEKRCPVRGLGLLTLGSSWVLWRGCAYQDREEKHAAGSVR